MHLTLPHNRSPRVSHVEIEFEVPSLPISQQEPVAPPNATHPLQLRPEAGGSLQRWLDLCG